MPENAEYEDDPSGRWKVFREAVESNKYSKMVQRAQEEDGDNLMFLASDGRITIRGLFFPPSAMAPDDGPTIFETAEKDSYLAIWNEDQLRKIILEFEEENDVPGEEQDGAWFFVMDNLKETALRKVRDGEVNNLF